MKLEAQTYLDWAEELNQICFFDIEASGLKGDYNSTLVVSILPFKGKPETYTVKRVGFDRALLEEVSKKLSSYHCWVTYYGKGFDIKMLNTRLTRWGLPPIPSRNHIDLYFSLKYHLLTARKSQGHLLSWLGTPESKMSVSASVWSEIASDLDKHMPTMIARCESDTKGLRALYKRTRHLIKEVKS